MADKQLSALTAASALADADLFYITQGGNSRKATGTQLKAFTAGGWVRLGGAYAAAGVWDFAVDGAVANVDFTGLAGATDIRLIMSAVTKSVSGAPIVVVSVNNGASYYTTSGDYAFMDTNGVRTNATTMAQFHLTNATAARDGIVEIQNTAVSPAVGLNVTVAVSHRLFHASTSAINAVRISPSPAANFTGGKFYCLVR